MTGKETFKFKTDDQQILNLIINSLYSNREVFLRELISNASDAIDRLRFKAQTDPHILGEDTEFKIKLTPDRDKRTLEIADNGIGMTRDEVIANIGTIAQSGTAAFMKAMREAQESGGVSPELIGQFGVGFYSAFIVADRITLITRAAGAPVNEAVRWESAGDGSYTLETVDKPERGTRIILHLKPAPEGDDEAEDFTEEYTIRHIIKKHSDFVAYPVVMDVTRDEPVDDKDALVDKDGKKIEGQTKAVTKEETLNSMKAIWLKDKDEVTAEEHEEFYKHLSHDWNPPLTHLHLKLEGVTEYVALLYIPSKAPFELFHPGRKHGLSLYSKRVFIMDDCKELFPDYLRFIKGVVDAPDLNLNVSREILQQDAVVRNIRKNLVKKVLDLLANMGKEEYEKFYVEFGQVLKEGMHTDFASRDKIVDLLRYKTTQSDGKWTSFKDYVAGMKEEQKEIYYITGENLESLMNHPHLEQLKEKGFEVLLMTDPVDEWVVSALPEYDGRKLKSAEKGDLDLGEVDKKKQKAYGKLFEYMKKTLDEKIKEVKPSTRLKDSMACLSGDTYDMSAYMEKILKASGQTMPETKRVLEINVDHPAIARVNDLFEKDKDDPKLAEYIGLIYDLALIGEGGRVANPSKLSKIVGELMAVSVSN
ncbi:MAG: molecular chaperone HtpG [Thermodesulfobacteriota bacterium]